MDLNLYFAIKNRCRHHCKQLGMHDGWLELTGELMAYLDHVHAELKEEARVNNILKN